MSISDFINTNSEIKFSPRLTPVVDGKAIKKKRSNPKLVLLNKGGLLTIINKNNEASSYIRKLLQDVEKSFATEEFDVKYNEYVSLLNALLVYIVGYMYSSSNQEQTKKEVVEYIEGAIYRRLPYTTKNAVVQAIQREDHFDFALKQIAKINQSQYFLFSVLGKILIANSKIVTIQMQEYISKINEAITK